jgi:hypothetical protein
MSTTTISTGRIDPLLKHVGVTRTRLAPNRTDKFPSIAATNPRSWSIRPYRTISSLCLRSVGIHTFRGIDKKQAARQATAYYQYNNTRNNSKFELKIDLAEASKRP